MRAVALHRTGDEGGYETRPDTEGVQRQPANALMAAGETVERLMQQDDACMSGAEYGDQPIGRRGRREPPAPVGMGSDLTPTVQSRLAALLHDNRTGALRGGASARPQTWTRFSGTKPALAGAPRRWSVASFLADTRSGSHLQEEVLHNEKMRWP